MTGGSNGNFGYVGTDYSHIPVSGSYSTVEFPDGYQPTPKPDDKFKYDYDYDYEKLSDPTQSIEFIRQRIKGQEPGTISALADHWVKVVQLLDAVQKSVADNADVLHDGDKTGFGGWSSPAATEFLRWGPGATLYSVKQWLDAAQANVRALRKLSAAVYQAHTDIDLAWQNYLDEARSDTAKLMEGWGYDPSLLTHDQQKQLPGPAAQLMSQIYEHQTAIWRKWSVKAQGIAYELSQQYYTQLEGDLIAGRGTRFEGPSNAVIDNPMQAMMPSPPGGGHTPAPAPAPAAPRPAAAPPPAATRTATPPPAVTTTAPPPLQQLADLADQQQQTALAPPPPPPASQIPAPLPLGGLALTAGTAKLLGLAPPTSASAPSGLLGSRPAPSAAPGTENNPGVLRSAANTSARASMPPGGMGRALRASGRATPPEQAAGRRATSGPRDEQAETRTAGPLEEPFESRTASASPSVLGGRRTTGTPAESMGDQAPLRPGRAPSVVTSTAARTGNPNVDTPIESDEPGLSARVLGSPGAARSRPTSALPAEDGNAQLRGTRRGSAAGPTPSELSSRHRARSDSGLAADVDPANAEDQATVVGDEAWVVPTPGGSLLTGRPDQPAYEAEHRPTLGGGAS